MTNLFKNKYRIPSHRLRGWNYAKNGHYFITIVTHGRQCVFGQVLNGEMVLNDIGQIVYDEFYRSFMIREELFLGEFVLMPNHLHAIVILDKPNCTNCRDARPCVSTGWPTFPQFQRQPKSISTFVACFKSSTINQIDNWIDSNHLIMPKFNNNNPLWQANYHDHIIRNEIEYQKISEYIKCNPIKWGNDILSEQNFG